MANYTYGTLGARRGLNGDIEALGTTSGLTGIEPVGFMAHGDVDKDLAKAQRQQELRVRRDYQAAETKATAEARKQAQAEARAIREQERFEQGQARLADAQAARDEAARAASRAASQREFNITQAQADASAAGYFAQVPTTLQTETGAYGTPAISRPAQQGGLTDSWRYRPGTASPAQGGGLDVSQMIGGITAGRTPQPGERTRYRPGPETHAQGLDMGGIASDMASDMGAVTGVAVSSAGALGADAIERGGALGAAAAEKGGAWLSGAKQHGANIIAASDRLLDIDLGFGGRERQPGERTRYRPGPEQHAKGLQLDDLLVGQREHAANVRAQDTRYRPGKGGGAGWLGVKMTDSDTTF